MLLFLNLCLQITEAFSIELDEFEVLAAQRLVFFGHVENFDVKRVFKITNLLLYFVKFDTKAHTVLIESFLDVSLDLPVSKANVVRSLFV